MTTKKVRAPWSNPSDAPVIEQSIHDYIVSIFRMSPRDRGVEIIPISPGAEAKRGWDAAVKQVVPLFFQYKLPDFTSRPQSTQAAAHARRQEWKFNDADGLFHFRLRAKAANEPRSQHELLVDLQDQGARVFYVSPSFIDFKRLRFGGELINESPWVSSHISLLGWSILERVDVPVFRDLICIPPHQNVDGKPEDHQFYFNRHHEVSLHSEAAQVEALNLRELLVDQIGLVRQQVGVVSRENYEGFVAGVIVALAGESINPESRSTVRRFFEAHLDNVPAEDTNQMMRSMRALARTVKKLSGIEMMLTIDRTT
ncbi:hypothetical protein [Luteimonas kalidii]|uniref:DUF4365 domain-containing protein n=1 Tax=Luteimonas kalidii TaxID=3042025 RepID=A0ABT6JW41_9GAMM|nr:hypothetical protein [Luteimonas kalidii]MDH5834809.1 hypothetical protein [Luteimonas kalidii]